MNAVLTFVVLNLASEARETLQQPCRIHNSSFAKSKCNSFQSREWISKLSGFLKNANHECIIHDCKHEETHEA